MLLEVRDVTKFIAFRMAYVSLVFPNRSAMRLRRWVRELEKCDVKVLILGIILFYF